MPEKKNIFSASFAELRDPRCLVLTGLFIAMNITMDLLNIRIQFTPDVRLGFGFILNASIGMLFGPVVGLMMGFCTDTLGFLLNNGGGAYFPGYTFTAMLAGLIWGLFMYRADHQKLSKKSFVLRVVIARVLVTLICNVLFNSYWRVLLGGKAMSVIIVPRLIKCIAEFPFQLALMLIVMPLVRKLYDRTFGLSKQKSY